MAATRRLFNYPGTKRYLTGMVSAICAKAHRGRVWVEPFCRSAALFYGLAVRPERALLNDADPHVMSMHQACRAFGSATASTRRPSATSTAGSGT